LRREPGFAVGVQQLDLPDLFEVHPHRIVGQAGGLNARDIDLAVVALDAVQVQLVFVGLAHIQREASAVIVRGDFNAQLFELIENGLHFFAVRILEQLQDLALVDMFFPAGLGDQPFNRGCRVRGILVF